VRKKPPCQVALAAKISTCAFSCRLCGEYGDGCCHLGVLSPQHVGGRIWVSSQNILLIYFQTGIQVIVVAAAKYRVSEIIAKLAQATCMGCMHLELDAIIDLFLHSKDWSISISVINFTPSIYKIVSFLGLWEEMKAAV
jgi:hypothetical protein